MDGAHHLKFVITRDTVKDEIGEGKEEGGGGGEEGEDEWTREADEGMDRSEREWEDKRELDSEPRIEVSMRICSYCSQCCTRSSLWTKHLVLDSCRSRKIVHTIQSSYIIMSVGLSHSILLEVKNGGMYLASE